MSSAPIPSDNDGEETLDKWTDFVRKREKIFLNQVCMVYCFPVFWQKLSINPKIPPHAPIAHSLWP